MPGKLTSGDIMGSMQRQLPFSFIPEEVWRRTAEAMKLVPVECFQTFWAFQTLRGKDSDVLPPEWHAQRQRARLFAATGRQRAAGDSKMGLDHILPPGLGPSDHFAEAIRLRSPFQPGGTADDDLVFAAMGIAVWGPQIKIWRQIQHAAMQSAKAAMSELSDVIEANLEPSVAKAAAKKRPAHMAFLSASLRWPDLTQAAGYVQGFPIIGEIPSSGLFRQLQPSGQRELETVLEEGFFGQAAITAIDQLEARQPSQDAEAIWRCVKSTIAKGSASTPQTRAYFDELYGRGRWRPMPTFLVTQGCGKERVINDGRAGEQNEWSEMLETIFTISVDFLAIAAHEILDAIRVIWTN